MMGLLRGWKELDRVVRGEATRPASLGRGSVELRVGELAVVIVLLAMLHGLFMGSFGVFQGHWEAWRQMVSSVVKVPALFGLTLAVTFPSLYVFNALVGSRLSIASLLRLLVAALGVTVAVLASLGPIVAFFSASTKSYAFMQLLNVAFFSVAGFCGTGFLLQTLHRLSRIVPGATKPPVTGPGSAPVVMELAFDEGERPAGQPHPSAPQPGALEPADDRPTSRQVRIVFRCWVVLFGLVGAQMGWVLRPFIGNPNLPFSVFRARESNVFLAILRALGDVLGG